MEGSHTRVPVCVCLSVCSVCLRTHVCPCMGVSYMHVRISVDACIHVYVGAYIFTCVCIHTCARECVCCTPDREMWAGGSSEAGGHGGMWSRRPVCWGWE